MQVICDRDGNVIQRSKNLAGIRSYVGKNLIKTLAIDSLPDGEGKLSILFENGASFESNFASWIVLKHFIRRWRNVYGATLLVNGSDAGSIDYHNPHLAG